VVSHRLLLCAMKWRGKDNKFGRGPIEQCVEDIFSVPRGGVEKTKIRSRTGRAVC